MLKNETVMAENNSCILKWFIWLSNFDYEIVYKPSYLNCLADMLTRESAEYLKDLQPALNMFDPGESSSGPARRRLRREMKKEEDAAEKPKTHEELLQKEGLFILPWDGALPRNVRIESLEYASTDEAKRFLQLTLIKNI